MAADNLSVIVIDDDEDVRRVMKLAFEVDGRFEVLAVGESAQDAIWLASNYEPDAILLDVRMPDLDGLAALPAIREQSPGTKVMAFSVLDEDLMRPQLEAAGVDAYLPKGTPLDDIIRRLVELCSNGSGGPAQPNL